MASTTLAASAILATGASVQVPSTKVTRPSRVTTFAAPPFSRSRSPRVSAPPGAASTTAVSTASAREAVVPIARIRASSIASRHFSFFIAILLSHSIMRYEPSSVESMSPDALRAGSRAGEISPRPNGEYSAGSVTYASLAEGPDGRETHYCMLYYHTFRAFML